MVILKIKYLYNENIKECLMNNKDIDNNVNLIFFPQKQIFQMFSFQSNAFSDLPHMD